MRFYICARYGRRDEAEQLAVQLQDMGHTITSSWLGQVESEMAVDESAVVTAQLARRDLNEVKEADALVTLSELEDNPWGRGGRHVEFGAALAFGKQVFVIGPMENLFHYLPEVLVFDLIDDFLGYFYEEETALPVG